MIEIWPLAADLQKEFVELVKPFMTVDDLILLDKHTIWRWSLDPRWNTHKIVEVDIAEGVSTARIEELFGEYEIFWKKKKELGIDGFVMGEPYGPEPAKAEEWLNPLSEPPASFLAYNLLTTEFPESVWAVKDILPVGLSLLAGRAKLGKSWLVLQLAQAVATGGHALGRHVEQGPVLFFALEDTQRRLKERMLKQGWPADPKQPAYMFTREWFQEHIGPLNESGAVALANLISQWKPRLTVIDTFSRAFTGDQNDHADVGQALDPIQHAALDADSALVIVDHHNKNFGGMDAVVNILGSTAKGTVADTLRGLYRERGKADAKLAITGRDVDEVILEIRWDFQTGCWQLESDSLEVKVTDREQEILDFLAGVDSATLEVIHKGIDRNKGNTYTRLQDLIAKGLVVSWDSPGGRQYALNRTKR